METLILLTTQQFYKARNFSKSTTFIE